MTVTKQTQRNVSLVSADARGEGTRDESPRESVWMATVFQSGAHCRGHCFLRLIKAHGMLVFRVFELIRFCLRDLGTKTL